MKKFSFHIFKKLPPHEKKITISTALTILRFILIPFIVTAMVMHAWHTAFTLFVIAAITDVLDGWTARWMNQKTFLGAALDPLADKLLILAVFTTLAFVQSPLFAIPRWFVVLVLAKEVIQILGTIFIFRKNGHLTIAPTRLGKWTMVAQTTFIMWLFSCYFFAWVPIKTYYAMLVGVLTLVFLAFIDYMRIGMAYLQPSE
jgi:cardiolipin synthase